MFACASDANIFTHIVVFCFHGLHGIEALVVVQITRAASARAAS
jgi:hypothetical protein